MPQSIISDRVSERPLAPAAHASGAGSVSDDLLFRKVAWRVIPFLFVCYVVSFLDRINIGFAQLQMKHDLGFSDAMYGLGAAIFYIGYVLCEVPSNMLLARFGARRTFMRIMLLWGIASTCMMFVHTPTHFYALRFLLGVFEAGFFPGIVLYLTYWFPPRRRAAVFSIFFAGVAVAGVLGGLVSGWIMRDMGGVMGLEGWRWMFAIEGLPAVLLGLMAAFWLVDGPEQARWLSDVEKAQLLAQREGASSAHSAHSAHASRSFGAALRNPRVYLFAFIYFSLTCASLGPARRAALALRGVHGGRRRRAFAAHAASGELRGDDGDSLDGRRADFRCAADLLGRAACVSLRQGRGGGHRADQQYRHYERHRESVGDRSHQDAYRQHGQCALHTGRAARGERRGVADRRTGAGQGALNGAIAGGFAYRRV